MQTIKLYYKDWYKDLYPIPNATSDSDIAKIKAEEFTSYDEFKKFINSNIESTRHPEFIMNQRIEEHKPGLIKLALDDDRKIYLSNNHDNPDYIIFSGKVRYDSLDFEKLHYFKTLNKRFLFINLHEGSYDDWTHNKLKGLIRYDNCTFISSNTIYENLESDYGIWFPFFAYSMGQEVNQYSDVKRQFSIKNYEVRISDIDKWIESQKEKKYYSLNKSCNRVHRSVFLLWLYKNGYLKDGYVSALLYDHIDFSDELFKIIHQYRTMRNLTKEDSIELIKLFPFNLDSVTQEEIGEQASPKYNIASYYENSCFNIVTETDFFSKGCNLTEKIFKPILNGQFFIPIGNKGLVGNLEKLGFKKYTILDYSFDECENDFQRLDMVLSEIDRFLKMTNEELIEVIKKDIDIIRENQKHFLSLNINDGFKILYDKLKHNENGLNNRL